MSNKILLLDIGNTSIATATYASGRLHHPRIVPNHKFPFFIENCRKSGLLMSHQSVICSTVPIMTEKAVRSIKRSRGPSPLIVGKNLLPQFKHNYRNINTLGPDRKVLIYGTPKMYRPPLLIIDVGTAITLDLVTRSGAFKGGLIIPGPETSFQALLDKAALIPRTLRLPYTTKSFLGNSTYDCLRSGTLEGFGAMLQELVVRFKRRYGRNLRVVATGGFTANLKPFMDGITTVDPMLLLKCLLLLYKENQGTKQ